MLSGVARPRPREEETGSINSDHVNMRVGTFLSNASNYMSAMRLAQVKGSFTDQKSRGLLPTAAKEMAPARGDERGPLTARTCVLKRRDSAGAREENAHRLDRQMGGVPANAKWVRGLNLPCA